MNWMASEGNCRGLRLYPEQLIGGTEKNQEENLVRTACDPAQTEAEHLSSTSLKCYRCANALTVRGFTI
jgi:hypothetical protein